MKSRSSRRSDCRRLLAETLFVSDLDGTLLNTSSALSDHARQGLLRLLDHPGVTLTFATARQLRSAIGVLPGIPLRLPVITVNGTFVIDPVTGDDLICTYLPVDALPGLDTIFRATGLGPMVYARQGGEEVVKWRQGGESAGTRYYLNKRRHDPRMRPQPHEAMASLYSGEVYAITLMDEHDRLQPVYDLLKTDARFYLVFHRELYRQEWWLSIYPRKANKGAGALFVKNYLKKERMVVFGDAINDLPLFKAADEAYAVSNAVPALREAATAVLGSNDQDAVINYLLEKLEEAFDD